MKARMFFFRTALWVVLLAAFSPAGPSDASCDKPRLLIILDRSVSMATGIVPTGETRWEAAAVAISQMTSAFETSIDFGLMVFPYPDRCNPGSVIVEPGPASAPAIDAFLAAPLQPYGNWTPMAETIVEASSFMASLDGAGKRVAVLVTDGEQWCFPYDPGTRFDPVGAAEDFFETGATLFVVGFGGEGVDALVLNKMAAVSGTALAGCDASLDDPGAGNNCYYDAADIESLSAVLESIALVTSEEICDGADNDCDGETDEDLRRPCLSACGGGEETCREGIWVDCDAPLPFWETCNGRDDDCDGSVDEMCECRPDETRPCGTEAGECRPGAQTCLAGAWSECQGGIAPRDEVCDGLDNDCNGLSDDGASCPGGLSCIEGACVKIEAHAHAPAPETDGENGTEDAGGCGCGLVG
jgi:hypothetical protein